MLEGFKKLGRKIQEDAERLDRKDPRVVWCVCGRQTRLRPRDAMTPSRLDVKIGMGIYVGFLGLMIVLGVPVFALFVVATTLVLLALLTIIRLLQGHSFFCAARWSFVAFFSLGRLF